MTALDSIKSLIKQDRLTEALSTLNALMEERQSHIEENHDNAYQAEALFLRGKIYWRLGKRSEAQNDYLASSALDPSGPATAALESARTIEAFFNPDLLNP